MKTLRPHRLRFWLVFIAVIAALIALKIYVANPDPAITRKSLDDLLVTLSHERVTQLRDQSWCRLLATPTVIYMNPSRPRSSDDCRPPNATTVDFDQRGEDLFQTAQRAMSATNLDLITVAVHYDTTGAVSSADFAVANHLGHSWYSYAPKSRVLSYPKATVTEIGGGWFFVETD